MLQKNRLKMHQITRKNMKTYCQKIIIINNNHFLVQKLSIEDEDVSIIFQ